MGFARAVPGVDVVVVGVDTCSQLRALTTATPEGSPSEPVAVWADLACDALDIVDPSRWRAGQGSVASYTPKR